MSDKNHTFGESDLGRGYDSVDIFGLDDFGDPVGLSELWGAVIGTGVGTLTAVGVRAFTDMDPQAELIGLLAGLGVGGAMWFAKGSTRRAGVTAMAAALLNNGIRYAEVLFNNMEAQKQTAAAATKAVTQGVSMQTMGRPRRPSVNGVRAEQMNGVSMNQLNAPASNVALLGGPQISAAAPHWGTNHFYKG